MTPARSRTTRTHGAARLLAVALLVLSYVAQPALALGLACGDHDCATEVACCCAPSEPEPAATAGCCAEDEAAPALAPSAELERCACRVQPVEPEGGGPVLPAPRSEAAGDASPAGWVRAHQECSANLPAPLPPDADAGPADGEHVPRLVAPDRASPRGGSWALLVRGMDGFLAVLMVARN